VAKLRILTGPIEDVLEVGEYRRGDLVTVLYDELLDLVVQANALKVSGADPDGNVKGHPLHPSLGGRSPYPVYPPLKFYEEGKW
jgi:hypothetical protein